MESTLCYDPYKEVWNNIANSYNSYNSYNMVQKVTFMPSRELFHVLLALTWRAQVTLVWNLLLPLIWITVRFN